MQRTRRTALARSATSHKSRGTTRGTFDANSGPQALALRGGTMEPHSRDDARCRTRRPPGSEALARRKPAPRKAMATSLARSPRTSSNFTICRARRGRTHHRRAWKRATSLPTELAQLERRLLAPGREFDDSAVEAAVAVAASPPPPLPFHPSARRCPKIPPAGRLTRSRDPPILAVNRFHLAARRDSRLPMAIQSPLLSLPLALSFDEHVSFTG